MSRMHFPWKRQICRSALAPHFRFGIWFGLELEQTVPSRSRISFPEGMAAMATANGKGTWAWARRTADGPNCGNGSAKRQDIFALPIRFIKVMAVSARAVSVSESGIQIGFYDIKGESGRCSEIMLGNRLT